MSSIRCRCFWHNWEPWKRVSEHELTNQRGANIGTAILQERVCKRCGLKQRHMLSTLYGTH